MNPIEQQAVSNVVNAAAQDIAKSAPSGVVKFFDSALGQSIETFLWITAAYALTLGVGYVGGIHWSANAIALGVPGLVNWAIYSVRVLVDKNTPNLPGLPKQ